MLHHDVQKLTIWGTSCIGWIRFWQANILSVYKQYKSFLKSKSIHLWKSILFQFEVSKQIFVHTLDFCKNLDFLCALLDTKQTFWWKRPYFNLKKNFLSHFFTCLSDVSADITHVEKDAESSNWFESERKFVKTSLQ